MNLRGILGAICGALLVALPSVWVRTQLTYDVEFGIVNCRAQVAQARVSGHTTNSIYPFCSGSEYVLGYTFASTAEGPAQGDQLTCKLVEHNAWSFSWNAPRFWFKDQTYSYEDCQVAKRA